MELFYAFELIFSPLDFLGINSRLVSWKLVSFIRNIKIVYFNMNMLWKNNISSQILYSKRVIYGKIETIRQYLIIANQLSKIQIESLDEMMYLKLFENNVGRTNYKYKFPSKKEIFFVIITGLVLISEVIL